MNLAQWLGRRAELSPELPALFLGQQEVADYAGFADRAARVAGRLVAEGVQPGDRVAIFMKNVPEYLVVFYGIWMAGAAVVPINAKLHGREALFILEDSGSRFAFVSEELTEGLDEFSGALVVAPGPAFDNVLAAAPAENVAHRNTDDLAWLFYTSGTTGQPKGVVRDHGGHAVALHWSMRHIYNVTAGDVYWAASAVGWVVGHSYIV